MLAEHVEPSDPQTTARDPESSELAPSPVSDTESVLSESWYESLLKQIPGFETYSYKSSPSTNPDGTLPARSTRANPQTPKFLREGLSSHYSVGIRTSNGQQNGISVDVLTTLVPQLYIISHKRKRLLQLEFEVEAVHRKLKRSRESLAKEVENGDRILDRKYSDVEALRQRWRFHSRKLRKYSQEMQREEDELEPLQYELTQAQFDIINLHDDLHASLTGGAKPGDSEASFEDRLLESLAGQFIPNPVISSETTDVEEQIVRSLADVQPAMGKPMTSISGSEGRGGSQFGTGLESSRIFQIERRPESPDLHYRGTEIPPNKGHDDKGPRGVIVNNYMDLMYCGSCFVQKSTGPYIDEAAQDHQLFAEPVLVESRKTDLNGVLGYPLQDLDRRLKLISTLETAVNIGVAQKLSETTLPSVHTRQMISLWTTAMSQNSALEASRTLLYGTRQSEGLARHISARLASIRLYSKVVLQLVQDVRQLQVPLDAKPNDPLITLNRVETPLQDNHSLKVHVASTSES